MSEFIRNFSVHKEISNYKGPFNTSEAAEHFFQLREQLLNYRSKVAEEYFRFVLVHGINVEFYDDGTVGDVDVNINLTYLGLNVVNTNQTPDIIFKIDNTLYVGDVAVTYDINKITQIKYEKYRPLRELIAQQNPSLNIAPFDFIVCTSDTASDVASKVEIIETNSKIVVKKAEELLSDIRTAVNITNTLDVKLKTNSIYYGLVKHNRNDELKLNDNVFDEIYNPILTEEQLSSMIFQSVSLSSKKDKLVTSSDNLDSVRNHIKEQNDKKSDRNIKTFIPILTNLDANENFENEHKLLQDYSIDLSFNCNDSKICSLIPIQKVIQKMELFAKEKSNFRYKSDGATDRINYLKESVDKYGRIDPYWASVNEMAGSSNDDLLIDEFNKNTRLNDKTKNPIRSINSDNWQLCIETTNKYMEYLSGSSGVNKSSNIAFDNTIPPVYSSKRLHEQHIIDEIKPIYNRINNSRAAVFLSVYRKFINDVAHMKGKLKKGIYYSIPVQKTGITLIYTNNNIGSSNPHIGFSTISRYDKEYYAINYKINDMSQFTEHMVNLYPGLVELVEESTKYYYVKTKIQKYDLDKMSKLTNVDKEFRTHAMSIVLLMNDQDERYINNYLDHYLGMMACLLSDLHQKPSELLDLMKYVVSMPFAYRSSIEELLKDKCNIMYKTNLDVWIFDRILNFYESNVKYNGINKPLDIIYTKKGIKSDTLNVKGKYRLFANLNTITENTMLYLTECQLLFHARPKKLYNSQFIDKACCKVVNNNVICDMQNATMHLTETEDWIEKGIGTSFPFDMSFAYSRDALYYAQKVFEDDYTMSVMDSHNKIRSKMRTFGLYNLSMRGGSKTFDQLDSENTLLTKDQNIKTIDDTTKKGGKKYKIGKSQTALLGGLIALDNKIRSNNSDDCTVHRIVTLGLFLRMFFNMSEKEQRGTGRPIGSADFNTKQKLYQIESSYQILSEKQNENLLVKGMNRNAKISSANIEIIEHTYNVGNKYIAHIVMDQSQFSEGDNTNKFKANIVDNNYIPDEIKSDMINSLNMMQDRIQFFPRIPPIDKMANTLVDECLEQNIPISFDYAKACVESNIRPYNSVVGRAGWVQGMLNLSSTHIHLIAVKWLTRLFKENILKELERNKSRYNKLLGITESDVVNFKVVHLVNSDDSYACVSSSKMELIDIYYDFLIEGKKMFTLKQNKKKSYLSTYMGEIIQKYVANGNVVNIYAKDAISVFNNNQGLDPVRDINASIGSLQNIYKNGGSEVLCCYVKHELQNQIYNMYNFGEGKINDLNNLKDRVNRYRLPVELTGWPGEITTFELLVGGSAAQLNYVREVIIKPDDRRTSPEYRIMIGAIELNTLKMAQRAVNNSQVNIFGANVDKRGKLYMNDIEIIENNDSRELYSEIDRNYIEFAIEAVASSVDITQTSQLLNPFNFLFPFPRKVSQTVDKLKSYDYTGTGLSGLIRTRQSIQHAVADIRDNANALVLQLSEEGLTKNIRRKAAASSHITASRSVTMGGKPYRLTILKAFKVLEKVPYRLSSEDYKTYEILLDSLAQERLVIPTIAHNLFYKITPIEATSMTHTIVNKIPYITREIETINDLQIVLATMVDPDIIRKENFKLRDPKMLDYDIGLIKSLYSGWSRETRNMLDLCKSIYFSHLSQRIKRWHIGPYLNVNSVSTYIQDCFLKCRNNKIIYCSEVNLNEISDHLSPVYKKTIQTVLTIWELINYLIKNATLNKDFECIRDKMIEIASFLSLEYNGITISIIKFVQSVDYLKLSAYCDDYEIKMLSILHYTLTGETYMLNKIARTTLYNIIWNNEQFKDTEGRYLYHTEFSVTCSYGSSVVKIVGIPGDIKSITSNTNDIRMIQRIIRNFAMKTPFGENWPMPKSKKNWVSGFWKSSHVTESQYIKLRNNGMSEILPKQDNDKRYKLGVLLNDTKRDIIPFFFEKSLTAISTSINQFHSLYVDYDRCKVFGLMQLSSREVEEYPILSFSKYVKREDYSSIIISEKLLIGKIRVDLLKNLNLLKRIVRNQLQSITDNELFNLLSNTIGLDEMMISVVSRIFGPKVKKITEYNQSDELQEITIEVENAINFDELDMDDDPNVDDNIEEILSFKQVLSQLILYRTKNVYNMNIIKDLIVSIQEHVGIDIRKELSRMYELFNTKLDVDNVASEFNCDVSIPDDYQYVYDIISTRESMLINIFTQSINDSRVSFIGNDRSKIMRDTKLAKYKEVVKYLYLTRFPDDFIDLLMSCDDLNINMEQVSNTESEVSCFFTELLIQLLSNKGDDDYGLL